MPGVTETGTTTADAEAERRVFAKIGWRLMPILILSYVFNYLDRNNVGFAGLTMNQAIGLTATEFGFGAGVFFIGYCLLEIPSNLLLYRVGARLWLSRIMISWGVASAATALAVGPNSFYALRLMLGIAEAGFFPGVAFYLGTWFPAKYRTRMIAWFMVAIPVSSVIGGPISGWLLGLDGVWGLAGWQWMFLLEGLPVVFIGLSLLWLLADRPEDVSWLTDEERRLVRERLLAERRPREVRHFSVAVRDIRVIILALVQFGFLVGSYGIGIFLPLILREGNLSDVQIGFVSSACYLVAVVGMILWAGHVDRGGSKVVNLSLACLVSACGFLGAILFSGTFWVSVLWMAVAVTGVNGARAIFWTIPPRFLTGMAAAGGLAFINSIGTTGGFVGPYVFGWLTDETGSFSAGLLAMSGFLVLAAVLAWSLRRFAPGE
ncbi:MAG TPA: MFS transporter [Vicinamibacterales bacterium]|nr:MFS transporter [Vicinamibacterales bacterium]